MGSATCVLVTVTPGSTSMTLVVYLGASVWWPLAEFTWLGTAAWLISDPLIDVVCPRSWFFRVGMSCKCVSRWVGAFRLCGSQEVSDVVVSGTGRLASGWPFSAIVDRRSGEECSLVVVCVSSDRSVPTGRGGDVSAFC